MLNRSALFARNVAKTFVRNHHGGTPGENLPFEVGNKYKLTLMFSLFFGSGLGAPFLIVRHQLLKHKLTFGSFFGCELGYDNISSALVKIYNYHDLLKPSIACLALILNYMVFKQIPGQVGWCMILLTLLHVLATAYYLFFK